MESPGGLQGIADHKFRRKKIDTEQIDNKQIDTEIEGGKLTQKIPIDMIDR